MLWTSDSCWERTVSSAYFWSKLRHRNILIWNSDSECLFHSNPASPFEQIFLHIFKIMKLPGDAILFDGQNTLKKKKADPIWNQKSNISVLYQRTDFLLSLQRWKQNTINLLSMAVDDWMTRYSFLPLRVLNCLIWKPWWWICHHLPDVRSKPPKKTQNKFHK